MTDDEIEKYYSCERIQCLICGKTYKSLNKHLGVHDLTSDEYKEQYGLPYSRALSGTLTVSKQSQSAKERIAEHGNHLIPGHWEGRKAGKPRVSEPWRRQLKKQSEVYHDDRVNNSEQVGFKIDRCAAKEILKDGDPQHVIAKKHGVTQSNVSLIKTGKLRYADHLIDEVK